MVAVLSFKLVSPAGLVRMYLTFAFYKSRSNSISKKKYHISEIRVDTNLNKIWPAHLKVDGYKP